MSFLGDGGDGGAAGGLAADAGVAAELRSYNLHAIWGASPSDIWVVGDDNRQFTGGGPGEIIHWNGTRWSRSAEGPRRLNDVWGSSANDVWAVGVDTLVMHWNGQAWNEVATPGRFSSSLSSVWGSGPSDVWVIGDSADFLHWDGTSWTVETSLKDQSSHFHPYSVWGSGPSDVWMNGGSEIAHWDGDAWEVQDLVAGLCLWGTSSNDVWAGGNRRWNGTAWVDTQIPRPASHQDVGSNGSSQCAVWGSTSSDVWVVGVSPGMPENDAQHRDGSVWSSLGPPTSNGLRDIWGSGSKDVWAVGRSPRTSSLEVRSTIVHWDGNSWSRSL